MKIFAISGLGADERVFNYLTLDHEIVPIRWIAPRKKETIIAYSKRLIQEYRISEENDYAILGVSFGGLIAIEMSKIVNPKWTILISSIETRTESSSIIKLLGKSKLLNLIPKEILKPPLFFAQFIFGTDQKKLLKAILKDSDLTFTKWALKELTNWKNETRLPNLIKIGGSKDILLPAKGNNTILIEHGAHFMIVDKAEEISNLLNEKLENEHIPKK
tara:strand:+ start:43 stop:696 length:654 start_codon:yes stop_codon:yes gene_type:complete